MLTGGHWSKRKGALSEEQENALVKAYTRTSESRGSIAARFGVSEDAVNKIIRRRGFAARGRGAKRGDQADA